MCGYRMSFLIRERLISIIADELRERIPQLRPYTSDYQMVLFAYQDLERWLRVNWGINSPHSLYAKLEEYLNKGYQDFKVFLEVWLDRWIEKWRERVKILLKPPKVSERYKENLRRARRIYRGMKHRAELKNMVIRRLIKVGEICMVESIADNLIIGEIAKRLQRSGTNRLSLTINPFDLFNSISSKIDRLPKEKGPLIFLRVGMHPIFRRNGW